MFYLGLDLGKRRDFSALAIVETERPVPFFDYVNWRQRQQPAGDQLTVRYLERMSLGTPYVDVVRRVTEVQRHPRLAGQRRLVVDATGVGLPVVDMLREADPTGDLTPVVLTGGGAEHYDGHVWHVPKLDLLAGLQSLLEREKLGFARGMREAETLVQELTDVRLRYRPSGRARLGADGAGEHDDLVIAVALACWTANKAPVGLDGARLFW